MWCDDYILPSTVNWWESFSQWSLFPHHFFTSENTLQVTSAKSRKMIWSSTSPVRIFRSKKLREYNKKIKDVEDLLRSLNSSKPSDYRCRRQRWRQHLRGRRALARIRRWRDRERAEVAWRRWWSSVTSPRGSSPSGTGRMRRVSSNMPRLFCAGNTPTIIWWESR